ncbi:uncharacterized protein M421DRAFT_3805 [Didymella exigua CBS 183.55]|uniref:Uncharacterized protein n=1 Tax=Didymella exigua CBS 183.55 TaxID=1150837 RepID=A0A6A5RRG8_9PLEO|nr:uncharacterized protein M421DRAFT_3805 [Didymella exigua CBS 183.55]KAF1930043.1 hypothetical protein M421DRAFT_3805 [Didymella exigua CBS 183.55]
MEDTNPSFHSASSGKYARRIAPSRKSKHHARDLSATTEHNQGPVETDTVDAAVVAAAFALMDLSLKSVGQPYELTEEERIRQNCIKDLTAILVKFLDKSKASGDTLDTEIDAKTLANHCELTIWDATYEQCGDLNIYTDAMDLEQTDFETWEAHWCSEGNGRSLFLEHVRNFHTQALTPSLKRAFELGRVQGGQ